jgi:hypothetical protein
MAAEPGGALVHLTVNEPLPLEAPAGNSVAVMARASCPDRHDRTGMAIAVTAPDGQAAMHAFAMHADGVSETAAIALAAPPCLGVHLFRFTLPAHEIAGTRYAQAVLDVPVRVTPQATSLAVWDVPSPVVAGTRFVIKAGAKSAANATLAGRAIESATMQGASPGAAFSATRRSPAPARSIGPISTCKHRGLRVWRHGRRGSRRPSSTFRTTAP